jgi:nucleoside diphosphate kinase homolog 5
MQFVSWFRGVEMSTIERTLALIKPDGMQHIEVIVKRIRDAGFVVLQQRTVHLSPEQASEFYRNEKHSPDYTRLVMALAAGPVEAMCLAKVHAIAAWKVLMGPERYGEAKLCPGTLRYTFANPDDDFENAVHGSANAEAATHEIHYFFPRSNGQSTRF